jgi:integrase
MGRRRSRATSDLPPYCYIRRNKIVYRQYLGHAQGKIRWGTFVTLGPTSAPRSHIWKAYEQASGDDPKFTLRWLLGEYHSSRQFKEMAPRTQSDYEGYRSRICALPTKSTKSFGDFKLAGITKPTIRKYLDHYTDRNTKHAPIAANRHIQYLKAAWNWGMERWVEITINPCAKVKLNKEEPRDRYVTDIEYYDTMACASVGSYIPIMMELAYLCRLRSSEVRSIQVKHIGKQGLRVFRSKGSDGEITAWTPRLRAAVNSSLNWNSEAPTPIAGAYLLHDKKGLMIPKNGYDSAWRRVINKAKDNGILPFTFNDLKAKGYTDQKKQDAAHRSEKMHRVYDRKDRVVEPADGEEI